MTEKSVLLGDEKLMLGLRAKPLKRGGLTSLLSLSDTAFKKISRRLIDLGYVYKPTYGLYALTEKGKVYLRRYYSDLRPRFKNKQIQSVIEKLPTEAHRSLFRLLLSGIVAKKYLYDEFEDGWCGFIIGGRTLSFKTRLARFTCHILDLLPESSYIRNLITRTAKEILGRRVMKKGGEQGLIPSPDFELPFIAFDELQKGNAELKRAVFFFLDGSREFLEEGVLVKNKACPLVTTNLDPRSQDLGIPEEYIRRSVVVNTKGLSPTPQEYDEATDEIFNNPIPVMAIDDLRVIFTDLETEERALIRELLYQGTKQKDVAVFDTQSIKILTLGWLILTQSKDPRRAIYEVCYDKLVTLETLDLSIEGWRDTLLDREAKYRGEKDPQFEKKRLEIEQRRREIAAKEDKAREKAEIREKEADEIRSDLVREWAKVDIAYKELVSQMIKARSLVPHIQTLLAVVRDDREKFGAKKKSQERLQRYERAFQEDREAAQPHLDKARQRQEEITLAQKTKIAEVREQADERAFLLLELKDLRSSLNKRGEPYTPAIKKLREVSHELSKDLSIILKRPSRFSTAMLREALRQAKGNAQPYLEQYQEDSKDLSEEMVNTAFGAGVDALAWLYNKTQDIGKKKPGGGAIGKPRKGKTLFEKWLEGRKKKGGGPENEEYDGRPFDEF